MGMNVYNNTQYYASYFIERRVFQQNKGWYDLIQNK
jgi:hypothetical protein